MSLRCFDRLSNCRLRGRGSPFDRLRDRGGVALRQAQGPQALGGWDLLDGHKKKRPGVLNLGSLMIITVLRVCLFPSASKDSGRADSQTWSCGRRPSTGTVAGAVDPDSRPYAR